jgi:hypothetical protein
MKCIDKDSVNIRRSLDIKLPVCVLNVREVLFISAEGRLIEWRIIP